MKQKTKIILGPPGTGKTTTLLKKVDEALKSGVKPERIAYVSFTKKAAKEAIDRAVGKFNLDRKRFIYFRTIHSLAYMLNGVQHGQTMRQKDYTLIAEKLGMSINIRNADAEKEDQHTAGDKCLRVYQYARAKNISLEKSYRTLGDDYNHDIDLGRVKTFKETIEEFKNRFNLLDFDDYISVCKKQVDVDLFIVDEAQDLTVVQWEYIFKVINKDCKQIIVAGDDDQAIYNWSGADVNDFLRVKGKREVLPTSYRLPRKIFEVSNRIISKIDNRIEKDWHPNKENGEGSVSYSCRIDDVDIDNGEEWLLLARTNRLIQRFANYCRNKGLIYSLYDKWSNQADEVKAVLFYENLRSGKEMTYDQMKIIMKFARGETKLPRSNHGKYKYDDIDWPWDGCIWWRKALIIPERQEKYITQILMSKNSLIKPGKIKISTIHNVKGGECDNVVVLLELGAKIQDKILTDKSLRDDEIRTFYVGATRARKNLHFIGRETFLQDL